MFRASQEMLANVGSAGRECSGDFGLAAAVDIADAPVRLLQCVFRCPPVPIDPFIQLAHLPVLA